MTGRVPASGGLTPSVRTRWPVRVLILLAVVLIPLLACRVLAAETFEQKADRWEKTAEQAKAALDNGFARTDVDLVKKALGQSIDSATKAMAEAKSRVASARELLDSLGPPPGKDKPPESDRVVQLRKEMNQRVSAEQSRVTQANLAISRANEILQSIATWQQARFRARLLRRTPSPVRPGVWLTAGKDLVSFALRVVEAPEKWWEANRQAGLGRLLLPFVLVPLLGFAVGWPCRLWLLSRFGRTAEEPDPTYARRIVGTVVDGVANALIPVAIIALTMTVLYAQGVLTGLFAVMFYSSGAALGAFLLISGLTRAAMSPHLVAWRIVPVQPAYVARLLTAVRGVVATLAVTVAFLATAFRGGMLSLELASATFFLETTVAGLLMAWALTPRYWEESLEQSQEAGTADESTPEAEAPGEETEAEVQTGGKSWFLRLRGLLRVLVLLVPFVALAGYGYLAFFLQSRLVVMAVLLGVAILVRLAVHELIGRLVERGTAKTAGQGGRQPDQLGAVAFWLGLAVDLVVFLPLLLLVPLIFGVPATTIGIWIHALIGGVQIGSVSLSPAGIIGAVAVFVIGVAATNLIRRWLGQRVLPRTRLDAGARNSISAGTGYLGVGLSLLVAVTTLGVDFSNLALVAGALSFGIGFGLQNLVQNFAAGVLMLIERPIKVGDWVVVGSTEGTVKRISVRSTEIETFDRSSVIVPNSEFISSPVTNWTYKNRLKRVIVPVGVAYGTDTALVARTLQQCAKEHRHVLRFPVPEAYFLGFGDSALNFELRCYVGDTDLYLHVLSDLHFAVDDAFRREGIQIPFPQRDIHWRSGPPGKGDDAAALPGDG